MKRRSFLKNTTGAMALGTFSDVLTSELYQPQTRRPIQEFIREMVRENDKQVPNSLESQQKDPTHPYYGGTPNGYGIYMAYGPAGLIKRLTVSFCTTKSSYYLDPVLLASMEIAASCLLKFQHEDGTVDLLTTNFHSPPDAGFITEYIAPAYELLRRLPEQPVKLMNLLRKFLLNTGRAMSIGGIHTPNHRWVVSMALSRIYSLFPDAAFAKRVDEWLAEGIDINEDGEYTERSNGYSALSNLSLITIARLRNKPDLLDPVRKNLELALYYLHSNNEIVTEISKRSDQYQVTDLRRFFYPYYYMAIKDQNPRFAWASDLIKDHTSVSSLLGSLPHFLEDDFLLRPLPKSERPENNYLRHFEKTDLIRWRLGDIDISALRDNDVFFTLHKKQAVLQAIRFASAFFGKGQFIAQTMELDNDKIIVEQKLEGPYYQPFSADQISGDGDWEKMPREQRLQSEVQHLTSRVTITQNDGIFNLQFNVDGTSHVPVAIELAFRKGGILDGVEKISGVEEAYLLSSSNGTYRIETDVISFGPGRTEHTWTQLRGALPKVNAMCVYITGFTPFHYTLKVG